MTEWKDLKVEPPPEIQMMAESIGFGPGYERTYKTFAVYLVKTDGTVRTSGCRTDRYFKTRRCAQAEADNINRWNLYRYDHEAKDYVRVENPIEYAFVEEIEVTERIR